MLVSLLIGLILGFYARSVYDKLNFLIELYQDRKTTPTGVSKPNPRQVSQHTPVESETGPSRAPDPKAYAILNQIEENRRRA